MKKEFTWLLFGTLSLLLPGCCTPYETDGVKLDRSQTFDLNLKLEGFTYLSMQQTGTYIGATNASAYNYQTNAYASGSASTVGSIYELRPDDGFAYGTVDAFEVLGFNIRSEQPDLVLSGRTGGGQFAWNNPVMYIRDGFALLIGVATFAGVCSYERENDARILVYDIGGKRIADYYSQKSCYVLSLAFPFANLANEKAYRFYGNERATRFALTDCLNQFTADLKAGKFDRSIKAAKAKYKEKKTDEN